MDLLGLGASFTGTLFKTLAESHSLKLSRKTMLRAYYFEVCSNIDLLDTIDLDKLTGTTIYSPSVISIVNGLEISIAASIIFSTDTVAKKLYDFLNKQDKIEEIAEPSDQKQNLDKTIQEAILFTIRKITLLQKLTSFKETEEEIIKPLLLKVRLKNIKTHFTFIRRILEEMQKKENF